MKSIKEIEYIDNFFNKDSIIDIKMYELLKT